MRRDIPDVVSLGRGDPDLPTAPHVVEAAVRALRAGHTHYTPRRGLDELREAIASKLRTENAVAVDADREVLITTGTQEAVMVLALALLDPGDEMIMPDPYYFAYEDAIRYAGGRLVTVPTTRSGNFEPDPDDIAAAITARTKALVLLTPNNPTGAVFSRATLQAIADLAIKRNLLVVADELYEKLVFDGAQHISLASLPGHERSHRHHQRVLEELSHDRLAHRLHGWAGPVDCRGAGDQTYVDDLRAEYVAARSRRRLDAPQDSLVEALQIYTERRAAFTRGLDAVGIPYFEPAGTFYVFADISRSGLTSDEFCLRLLREAAVFAYPGTHFGHYGEGFIRISLLAPVARLMEGLDRIGRFLEDVPAAQGMITGDTHDAFDR